jgi:bifunctional non-homologous end joining protein LigD
MSSKSQESLSAYHAKRDFTRTAEPRGKKGSAKGHLYVIQKHDATRLHFDFRLELDGVLKSWAITRGPSLDPGEKRLAVHVEDHPLDYGSFEGTIPEGEYGGGTVMLWDRGTWAPDGDPHEGLRKGKLSFVLNGQRLKGGFALVRMRPDGGKNPRDNWLLIKERDRFADPDLDPIEKWQRSVKSRRTMAGIARAEAKPRKVAKR